MTEKMLGMLYIVDVRLVAKSGERIKQKILMVGCEKADIERKLKWVLDAAQYKEMSISGIEKVREKVHVINTIITEEPSPAGPIVTVGDRSVVVPTAKLHTNDYAPKLFAVGIVTQMLGSDEYHALRKVGNALTTHGLAAKSHNGPRLSEQSTISVEEIPLSSAYAKPRDVSNEINPAHFVRG